jgi:hypothetical protein
LYAFVLSTLGFIAPVALAVLSLPVMIPAWIAALLLNSYCVKTEGDQND